MLLSMVGCETSISWMGIFNEINKTSNGLHFHPLYSSEGTEFWAKSILMFLFRFWSIRVSNFIKKLLYVPLESVRWQNSLGIAAVGCVACRKNTFKYAYKAHFTVLAPISIYRFRLCRRMVGVFCDSCRPYKEL